eukprot:TRINITY_DN5869_c0_g2_i1.p1 TRINITY_DN5869_c0_g2~~TRINITY_DN5869_c0_g2_i1.p1  ORF type:complete len:603 (+),score=61.16 TRINITY_DN5869_c0_g2_i1:37-1845(+)
METSVVPIDAPHQHPKQIIHGWKDEGPREASEGDNDTEDAQDRRRFKSVLNMLARLDLRFREEKLSENGFKQSLEPEILKYGALIAFAGALLVPCTLIPVLVREAQSTRNPLDFQNWDVRFTLSLIWCLTFTTAVSFCLASCLRMRYNWFQNWNWELYFMIVATSYVVSLSLANFWHMPFLAGTHPSDVWQHDVRGTEVFILLAIDGLLTAVAMYVPIRSCVLWILPCCGVGSYLVMLLALDVVMPNDRHLTVGALALLAFFSMHGAFQNDKRRRENWKALCRVMETEEVVMEQTHYIADASALVRGLTDVATALCDFLLHLSTDLKITSSQKTHSAFFEADIEGVNFVDLLGKDDAERFQHFIELVTDAHVPACLPVTVNRAAASTVCHLLVVDTGKREPRYLMGIRVEREDFRSAVLGEDQFGDVSISQAVNAQDVSMQDISRMSLDIPGDFEFSASRPIGLPHSLDTDVRTLGLVPAATLGGALVGSWTSSAAMDSDISFSTYPKRDPPPPPSCTPVQTRARSLQKLIPRWQIPRNPESCCHFHTVVRSLPAVVDYMESLTCEPLWSTIGNSQCSQCKSMVQDRWHKCVVCGNVNRLLT